METSQGPVEFDSFEEPMGIEDFEPEIREATESLMWLGYIEDNFEFCGHTFVLRTLKGDEELLASLVCKEYVETWGQHRAWAWAQVALALVSVDGDTEFCPQVSVDKKAYARARFNYCTSNWVWAVAEFLYGCYAQLLQRQAEVLQEMESLSQGNLPTFTPFAGSSTDKGDSGPKEDIRDYLGTDQPDSTPSNPDFFDS